MPHADDGHGGRQAVEGGAIGGIIGDLLR
jgi:hypothetical protein